MVRRHSERTWSLGKRRRRRAATRDRAADETDFPDEIVGSRLLKLSKRISGMVNDLMRTGRIGRLTETLVVLGE